MSDTKLLQADHRQALIQIIKQADIVSRETGIRLDVVHDTRTGNVIVTRYNPTLAFAITEMAIEDSLSVVDVPYRLKTLANIPLGSDGEAFSGAFARP